MKKMIIGALIFISASFAANDMEAQSRMHPNNNSSKRIQHGVIHGKLTRAEAHNLRSQQAHIRQMKRMAMADGYISPKERKMLAQLERRASRNIYYQKHDRQNRF